MDMLALCCGQLDQKPSELAGCLSPSGEGLVTWLGR